jgi:pimeloyl-ACP methyl ester carboxylesterase
MEAPTVVFLHGLSSNHTTWDETLSLYKDAGFNTLSVDLRGHGLSDKTRKRSLYKIPTMGDDVIEIIKQEGLKKVSVVGYSYGGYIGIDLAIHHPELVENLVLVSTNHVSQFVYHWSGFANPVIHFLTNALGWLLVWQSRKKYYYFDPKAHLGYWSSTFSGYATMPFSINFWMLSEVFGMDYRQEISQIKCPTLIVRGAGDTFITERETNDMNKKINNSKVVTVGTGHYVASYFQTETAKEAIKFLKP